MICIPVLPLGRSICVRASEAVSSSAALPLTDCGHRAPNMQTPAPLRAEPLVFAEMLWLRATGTGQENVQHVDGDGCILQPCQRCHPPLWQLQNTQLVIAESQGLLWVGKDLKYQLVAMPCCITLLRASVLEHPHGWASTASLGTLCQTFWQCGSPTPLHALCDFSPPPLMSPLWWKCADFAFIAESLKGWNPVSFTCQVLPSTTHCFAQMLSPKLATESPLS